MSEPTKTDPPDVVKGDKGKGSDPNPPGPAVQAPAGPNKPNAAAAPAGPAVQTHDDAGKPIHVAVGDNAPGQNRPEGTALPADTPGTKPHAEKKLEELEKQRADDDGMKPLPPDQSPHIPNPRPAVRQAPPPLDDEPEKRTIKGGPASAPPAIDPATKR